MLVDLRGEYGEVRVGWYVAASLSAWRLAVRDDKLATDRWECAAGLATQNDYWLASRGPFDLWLQVADGWWVWRSVAVAIRDERIEITGGGSPESR